MRLTILVVLATSEARRSRNHPNAPRDNPFVVKNTHTMRDAFIVEELKETYHGGDQRLLNLARLGTDHACDLARLDRTSGAFVTRMRHTQLLIPTLESAGRKLWCSPEAVVFEDVVRGWRLEL